MEESWGKRYTMKRASDRVLPVIETLENYRKRRADGRFYPPSATSDTE